MSHPRTVIISDTHLGRPHAAVRHVAQLRPLWQGAAHLIVNGDAAEVHHPRHWSQAACEVLKLYDFCEQDGVELTLLSGNHDPFLSDIRHLHLADNTVFVTHGDVLHPAIAPWSPAAGRMRAAHDAALATLEPETRRHLESRLSVAQHASLAEWQSIRVEAEQSSMLRMLLRPWALAQVLHYWHIIPRLTAQFAAEHAPEARYIITGHTHRPGIWRVGPRTIINTGSFGFPGTPRVVVLDGEALTVWKLRLTNSVYELASSPQSLFAIPATSAATLAADVPATAAP